MSPPPLPFFGVVVVAAETHPLPKTPRRRSSTRSKRVARLPRCKMKRAQGTTRCSAPFAPLPLAPVFITQYVHPLSPPSLSRIHPSS
uniref:Putative secreted protein n=1 Tax=Ixodes ricinus TaxID=34613 RepID=A0A6B0UFE3_IXORI